ncbi:hypothetical protein [Azotobacter armeniacus]
MTMSHPQAVLILAGIAQKPGTTKRDSLTIARRVLRRVCAYREAIHDERRALRREAALLRQFEPFTKQQADALEQQARDYGAAQLEAVRPVLLAYGGDLIRDHSGYMEALGFDGVCDLP